MRFVWNSCMHSLAVSDNRSEWTQLVVRIFHADPASARPMGAAIGAGEVQLSCVIDSKGLFDAWVPLAAAGRGVVGEVHVVMLFTATRNTLVSLSGPHLHPMHTASSALDGERMVQGGGGRRFSVSARLGDRARAWERERGKEKVQQNVPISLQRDVPSSLHEVDGSEQGGGGVTRDRDLPTGSPKVLTVKEKKLAKRAKDGYTDVETLAHLNRQAAAAVLQNLVVSRSPRKLDTDRKDTHFGSMSSMPPTIVADIR